MDAAVELQTLQLRVFAVGHAVKVRPPVDPHPVTAFGLVAKAVVKVEVVAKPVMVAVAAVVQVFAAIALVGIVTVILAIPLAVTVQVLPRVQVTPLTVVDALARLALGSKPLTSAVKLTGPNVTADSFTPSPVAGVAAWKTPAVMVAGSFIR
jgi:hypothetical protein